MPSWSGLPVRGLPYLGQSKIKEKLQEGLHIMVGALVGQSVSVLRALSGGVTRRIKGRDSLQGCRQD